MPRFSVVIPVQGSVEALERSLISVLEKRPADCEILVVLNTSYEDPYQLTDEVRYLDVPAGSNWSQCVAAGLAAARTPIVNLLAAGVEVAEDWTRAALDRFRNPAVWAIAPATHDRHAPESLLSSGVATAAGAVIGPRWWSGFYRKGMLECSVGGFDSLLDPPAAEGDLAWRQTLAGRICIADPGSIVYVSQTWTATERSFRAGYQAERVFWRQRAGGELRSSLVAHALTYAQGAVTGLLRPNRWLPLLGGLAACTSASRFRREGARAVEAAATIRAATIPTPPIKAPHMLRTREAVANRDRNTPSA